MDFERLILDLQARCSRLEDSLDIFATDIARLCKADLQRHDMINDVDECMKDFDQTLIEEKKNLQDFKTAVSNAFRVAQEDIKYLDEYCLKNSNAIVRLEKEINSCKEKNDLYFNTTNTNLATLREDFQRETQEKIKAIPAPQIPTQEEINAQIHFKLEPVGLDAKNGVLRSANCEMKIMIMEKKIDQIFLLLQKHSITP